jgi:hypothetical protein
MEGKEGRNGSITPPSLPSLLPFLPFLLAMFHTTGAESKDELPLIFKIT